MKIRPFGTIEVSTRYTYFRKKEKLLTQLEKIIGEFKRLGIWEMTEAQFQGSFMGQLRFGMIPGSQSRLTEELPLPEESNLGAFAVREFDGQSEFSH